MTTRRKRPCSVEDCIEYVEVPKWYCDDHWSAVADVDRWRLAEAHWSLNGERLGEIVHEVSTRIHAVEKKRRSK